MVRTLIPGPLSYTQCSVISEEVADGSWNLAVIGLTKSDANNYGEHQIRINAICPGFVATPLLGKGGEKGPDNPLQPLINRTASKRLCEPEEIADSIVCIASSMNSYMQGSSVIIDGGFTAN